MIKFFRHIRQSLVMENLPTGQGGKTGKYLKYAIGEIILVVIGILIALQINNWNQNRLEKIRSMEYHDRMVEELDFMIESFKWDSTRAHHMTKRLVATVRILETENNTESQIDTLDFSLKNYFQFVRINNTLNTYEEIKSSGDLGLIYNKELRKSINFYISRLNAISKIYDQLASQVNESSLFDQYIRMEVSVTDETDIAFDVETLKRDKILINKLSRFADHWKAKMNFSTMIITMSEELKTTIKAELEND